MIEKFKKDYELYHSSFQIEHFILVKNGKTPYGIYKQCLRELMARESTLRSLYAGKLRAEINFEKLLEQLNAEECPYALRHLEIDKAEALYGKIDMDKVIKETEREYTHFYNAAIHLKKQLGELTEEKKKKLEEEMWVHNCKYRICSDIRTIRAPSVETINLIDGLPNDKKNYINKFLNRIALPTGKAELDSFLLEYTRNYEFGQALDKGLPNEIRKLVEHVG